MATFHAVESGVEDKLANSLLIVADVSIGNVGQLAADLLISTMEMSRVGIFDDPAVIPIVGAEVGGAMCTSLELYGNVNGVYVLQQRAAVIPSQADAFAGRMAEWMSGAKFGVVLVLSSLPASIRTDRQLADENYQMTVVCALDKSASREAVAKLSWELIEADVSQHTAENALPHATAAMHEITDVSRGLLHNCKESGLDLAVFMAFCEEGDNINDGMQMASKVREYAGDSIKIEKGWKAPASWRMMMEEQTLRGLYT